VTVSYRREWAKAIGRRRLDAFERALTDPDLVSMKQELAKLDLRVADLEARAAKGESRSAWGRLRALATELEIRAAQPEPDAGALSGLAGQIVSVSREGLDDFTLWDEVKVLVELRRRIADTERKYEELHKVLIPAAQVVRLFDDLHAAIEACVPERAMQLALLQEVRARVNGDARRKAAVVPIMLPAAYDPDDAAPDVELVQGDGPVDAEPDRPDGGDAPEAGVP
jgi:hypothetical protein